MSTANLHDSTNKPLYGERIIEESNIICFENPNKKEFMKFQLNYLNLLVNALFRVIQILQN